MDRATARQPQRDVPPLREVPHQQAETPQPRRSDSGRQSAITLLQASLATYALIGIVVLIATHIGQIIAFVRRLFGG